MVTKRPRATCKSLAICVLSGCRESFSKYSDEMTPIFPTPFLLTSTLTLLSIAHIITTFTRKAHTISTAIAHDDILAYDRYKLTRNFIRI